MTFNLRAPFTHILLTYLIIYLLTVLYNLFSAHKVRLRTQSEAELHGKVLLVHMLAENVYCVFRRDLKHRSVLH